VLQSDSQYSQGSMTTPISTAKIPSMPTSRRYAIVLAALLLGVPIVAVASRASGSMREPQPLQAAIQQTPRTADIAVLEASARTAPTVENRLNLSVAYINANAPERAVPILLSVIAEDKNNDTAWNNLCVAHNLEKDYTDGVKACRQALDIDPHFQLAANNLKWAMDELKKDEQRLAATSRTSASEATSPSQASAIYLAQGLRQLNSGDYDAAIDSWQRILALDPSNALAANNIGTAYMFKKEPATALTWFQKAVKSDPTLQIARNNIAWATEGQARTAH
jgi:tetratricopeptide (TPR) repeat protein